MKKQTSLLTLGLMLATPALAGGGGAPAAPATPAACKTIAQIVMGDPNFSTLATALDSAGLTQTLQSGEYTVFAPTNGAFAKLPSDTLAAALNDPAMLKSILLYHVVKGKAPAAKVVTMSSATTLEGSSVLITVNGKSVMVDNANVTKTDVMACNGIVHVIDTVLMPAMDTAAPAVTEPAPVAEAAPAPAPAPAAAADATPAPAAPAADATPAPAPATDAAPAAVDISSIPALPLSGATITTDTATASDTATTTTDTTEAATTDATATTDAAATTDATATDTTATATTTTDTATTAADATATTTDTTAAADTSAQADDSMASNTLYDVIVNDDRFTTLRDLLSDAGLTDVIMANEYTIFAPTNAAFDALDQDQLALIASDPATLKKVLMYHVVVGKQTGEQLAALKQVASAEGDSINVSSDGTMQMVGDAKVDGAPIEASNGTVFVIDKVLLPPNLVIPTAPAATVDTTAATTTTTDTAAAATTTTATTTTATTTTAAPANVVALLQGLPQYSTLVSLIQKAGLADTLATGDYTVFAPTNDAFAKVPQATLDTLNADPAKLKQVLLFHVVSGKVVDAGLNVAQLKSLEGSSIDLKGDGGNVMLGVLNGTTITGAMLANSVPMTAGNSVVYSIDAVLIPPTLK
ncbi:fasciclin domain-containing protein [Deinococcus sp. KSM4-11]|uniref:fasciclin domain-containing protein n=1 Tax=Deinococcus sp. KSM4-11 TaxID=2568654 RepID=UPI0010A4F0F7|nr:fasciclin domain-containing protein [Deinococcus sp. KSM4-11]THF88127.1 fasciclin domain-containing protein [Deinococcus sp. KSM4-11]